MKQISNEEKLKLVMAKDWWETEDLGGKIGKVKVSDGPVGLRCLAVTDSWANDSIYPSVAYPCYQMLSQTWNLSLAHKMGRAIADDCIEHNVDVLLGPGVNIKRTPLCGRNFEYFSEDPYVAGMFGKSFIEGVQAGHVGTSLKHYCCNNREYSRYWLSSEVDERTLREIYLKPFEIAVQAEPWTVMTSYNLVNGVRMSANKKLNQVLRNEFGFEGVIVSDWEAVQNPLDTLHSDLDLEFPHNDKHAEEMQEHLSAGRVDLECLDKCSGRIIALGEKAAEEKKLQEIQYSVEERIAISQEVEEEGIVLLKNNGVLPLKNQKIYVTGLPSQIYYHGGGSSAVIPNRPFVPLDEALRNLGYDAYYSESIGKIYGANVSMGNVRQACLNSEQSDVTIFTVGTGAGAEVEETDRRDITLTPEELSALHYLRKYAKKLVIVVYAGSAVDLSEFDQLADAVVLAGFGGQNVSQAVANVLTGKVNPSGRLTETYAYTLNDIPSEHTYRDEAVMVYEEGLNVGYRYFETQGVEVLYPFGYGLSYSEFEYSDLKVKVKETHVEVEIQLENVSDVDGKEVVQIYVNEMNPVVYRPIRELKAFEKVFVKAHEKVKVRMQLGKDAFSYYSTEKNEWVVNPGNFIIEVRKNAHEIELAERIKKEEKLMNYWTQSPKNIYVAAHRGWPAKYPENTMESFKASEAIGVDQLEIDVRVTKDDEFVIIHDATVDRTTNGTGLVCEHTLEELKALDAGSHKGEEFKGVQIPTFIEFMDWIKDHPTMTLDVELKEYPTEGREEYAYSLCDRVLKIIDDYGYTDRVVINTWSGKLHEYINGKYSKKYRLHSYYPQSCLGEVSEDPYAFPYCCCMFTTKEEWEPMATKEECDAMLARGVQPWAGAGVDSEERVDMVIERGAYLITCNNPDEILGWLRKKGYHK